MTSGFKTAADHSAYHTQVLLNEFEGVYSVGEDAYFRTKDCIGVSDGVSSWSLRGKGNAAYFAYYLMAYSKLYAEKGSEDTKEIISKAYDEIWSRYSSNQLSLPCGSATACVVHLSEEQGQFYISYASIGDSMVIVLRSQQQACGKTTWKVVHESDRKYVNMSAIIPMQLTFSPVRTPRESVNISYMEIITAKVSVCAGDIVIVATDGLWDNLSAKQTVRVLNNIVNSSSQNSNLDSDEIDPVNIASGLVKQALRRNKKPDDITVVVGIVNDS